MKQIIKEKQIFINFYSVEHQVHRIETKQAPKPSQPEVVLSDGELFNKISSLVFYFFKILAKNYS